MPPSREVKRKVSQQVLGPLLQGFLARQTLSRGAHALAVM